MKIINEIWKDVHDYVGFYQVSNLGRLKSVRRIIIQKNGLPRRIKERIFPLPKTNVRYYRFFLNKNGNKNRMSLHRIVATAFIPNPENKPQVNHIDGNKLNNCVENLEWCTAKENVIHCIKNGLNRPFGKKHFRSKLNDEDVRYIVNSNSTCLFLAKKFSVSINTISKVRTRKLYKYVLL